MKKARDLGAKAAHGSFWILIVTLLAGFTLFSLLPVIFDEENAPSQDGQVSASAPKAEESESGLLPLIKSYNPFRYFKRAAALFAKNKNSPAASYGANAAPGGTLQSGAPEAEQADLDNEEAALEEDVFYSPSGAEISPDENGYFYQGQYYKYGTYPSQQLREAIEKEISKWHNKQAARSGRSAVYIEDEDGALHIKYFNQNEIDGYFAKLKNEYKPDIPNFGIAQEDGSIYTGGLAGKAGSARARGASGSMGQGGLGGGYSSDTASSIESKYNMLMAKAKEIEQNYKDAKNKEAKGGGDFISAEDKLAKGAKEFNPIFFTPRGSALGTKEIPADFKDAVIKVDSTVFNGLGKYLKKANIQPVPSIFRDTPELYEELNTENGKIVLYSRFPVPERIKKKLEQDKNLFLNNFTDPVYKPGQDFTKTFFTNTSMDRILKQFNLDEGSIKEIEDVYVSMGKDKKKFFDKLREKSANPERFRAVVIFFLGSDPDNDNNVVFGGNNSFLNVYNEDGAPSWIKTYGDKNYISVPSAEALKQLGRRGVAVVTMSDQDAKAVKDATGRDPVNLPLRNALSIYPDQAEENFKEIKKGLEDAQRVSYSTVFTKEQEERFRRRLAAGNSAAAEAVGSKK